MKSSMRLILAAGLLSTPFASAHPGHDGHELTWDFHGHTLWSSPAVLLLGTLAIIVVAFAYRHGRKRN
jgi:hypothetical protein